jgi:hypothetical protein
VRSRPEFPAVTSSLSLTQVTDWLVSVSDRLIPSSSEQVLKLISPASFRLARHETRELALAFIWGVGVIVGTVLMLLLGAGGNAIGRHVGDDGLVVGHFLTWFAVTGLVIHAARYLAASTMKKSIERTYAHRTGRSSSEDAALGKEVHEESPRVLLALTRSSDWDLGVQGLLGLVLTILTH